MGAVMDERDEMSTFKWEGSELGGWRYTVSKPRDIIIELKAAEYTGARYDVMTWEEVKDKHKPHCAVLWAAVTDLPYGDDNNRRLKIEGIGEVEDGRDYGPWFFLDDF